MSDNSSKEKVHGYEIKRSILFENDRGFALGENPQAVQPFVTWQFTAENGKRDYYWGHYTANSTAATRDYENRIAEYQHDYGVSEKSAYKYYSTQRPVDIGTFPKTENGPLRLVNFDSREGVEQGQFKAWGYLVYDSPLTEKQIADYELRAAPGNPDIKKHMREQAQIVGIWEDEQKISEPERFTWYQPSIHAFALREPVVAPERLERRYHQAKMDLNQLENKRAVSKPIAARLAEGAAQAAKDNATRPASTKKKDDINR